MRGIFYGSNTGVTEQLAKDIAGKLNIAPQDIHDVGKASASDAGKYDLLLLGSSTWGYGELQDDWEAFLPKLAKENLSGKKVALFGTGDSETYPDTFCDALGIIADGLESTGCTFVGEYPADGYTVSDSRAFREGMALGLAADDVNEAELTESRMEEWISHI